MIDIPKSSKLHRYVNKVRKLYHARYKCNKKRDPKIINLNEIAIPKKAYLLSFFSRHYHRIMKLKCKARRYLSLFSCNTPIQEKTGSRMETRPKGPSVFASPGGKYKLDKQSLSKEFQDGPSKY